ncbi:MAG: bifunctional phosphopantothenoylcysteine decarboxylase/phosphopantothenate--cysteine ligase CoaBC [Deltaproteobacteria bacterium]|nr:bifunctional phosphopantothenoylcysteine decarboxylase/phosphopantothenate--cysteine ligase CoaBC [Deltaproteobacteria bacterium]MBW1875025.1 bifunctional phosphopantothenoylcysteine decarboxylase/phosphopantothenate--cysteine ligase CoaBC [Deltaproteobacteria bacterium]MBW2211116.1 bifunctional phosphopantothenoylcysteine decarboxylase/phosphopantothenate--cysteine ligase CoaBC [Deltaproteobacteria bacterium]MBW2379792.1 bifunctional phosphopantothenoylcysteine decarboxylase/phosphopantothen
MSLQGKRIVVGLGGGIAAFKAVQLVRELMRRGAEVRVVMTEAATHFVGPITFAGLTGKPAVTNLWAENYAGEVHVELGEWADAVVIAPATMNLMARATSGQANDVVLATLACARGDVFFAPSMHHRMWAHPATQSNIRTLTDRGAVVLGPVTGALANGEIGEGRMMEPDDIADEVESHLAHADDLSGSRVLITAGPTHEDLDPVRFLGNRSSGRMGYAIASQALRRGAEVTIVSGPVHLPVPSGAEVVRVRSAQEMHAAVMSRFDRCDVLIMAAAVADYRPEQREAQKIKKGGSLKLELVRNPDILADVGAKRSQRPSVLVGFALETENLEQAARDKLERKAADLIVANEASAALGGDTNRATLVEAASTTPLPEMTKRALANQILDRVRTLLTNPSQRPRREAKQEAPN